MQEFICEYTLIENYREPSERWITEVVVKDNYEEAYQFYLAIVESMHRDIQMYDFLNRRIFSSITVAEVSATYPNGKVIHYYNKSQIEEQIAKESEIRQAVTQSGVGYSPQNNPMVVQGNAPAAGRYHRGYEEKPFYSKMFNGWNNNEYPRAYNNQNARPPQNSNYDLYYLNQLNSRNGQAYMPRQQAYQRPAQRPAQPYPPVQMYNPPLPQPNVYVQGIANQQTPQPNYPLIQYPPQQHQAPQQVQPPQPRPPRPNVNNTPPQVMPIAQPQPVEQYRKPMEMALPNIEPIGNNVAQNVSPIGAPVVFDNFAPPPPQPQPMQAPLPPPPLPPLLPQDNFDDQQPPPPPPLSESDVEFRENQIFDGSPDPDNTIDRQIIMMSLTGNEIDSIFDGDFDVVFGEAPPEDFDRVIVYDLDADAVVGEFDVSEVITDDKKALWKDFKKDSPMKHSNYKKFFKGLDEASAIITVNPFFYNNEKTLEDFRMAESPEAYEYLIEVF